MDWLDGACRRPGLFILSGFQRLTATLLLTSGCGEGGERNTYVQTNTRGEVGGSPQGVTDHCGTSTAPPRHLHGSLYRGTSIAGQTLHSSLQGTAGRCFPAPCAFRHRHLLATAESPLRTELPLAAPCPQLFPGATIRVQLLYLQKRRNTARPRRCPYLLHLQATALV